MNVSDWFRKERHFVFVHSNGVHPLLVVHAANSPKVSQCKVCFLST